MGIGVIDDAKEDGDPAQRQVTGAEQQLGVGVSRLLTKLQGWSVTLAPSSILLSFGFAAAIGIFFGWYPARKAAALNPIDALRYE